METRSPENLLHTKGVVVYMAHPFGGSFENQILREKNYAETRGIHIAQLNEDHTLRWVGQEKS